MYASFRTILYVMPIQREVHVSLIWFCLFLLAKSQYQYIISCCVLHAQEEITTADYSMRGVDWACWYSFLKMAISLPPTNDCLTSKFARNYCCIQGSCNKFPDFCHLSVIFCDIFNHSVKFIKTKYMKSIKKAILFGFYKMSKMPQKFQTDDGNLEFAERISNLFCKQLTSNSRDRIKSSRNYLGW